MSDGLIIHTFLSRHRVVSSEAVAAQARVALQSKTGRDRSRELRLWLVERPDRSWFWRPVLDLQRGPGRVIIVRYYEPDETNGF